MFDTLDTIVSIVNSLFSIILLFLSLIRMKNNNLIVISIEDVNNIVINSKGIAIFSHNHQSSLIK